MIDKNQCAACYKRHQDGLVKHGGWYYHQECLDKLLQNQVGHKGDKAMFERLNRAFNKALGG